MALPASSRVRLQLAFNLLGAVHADWGLTAQSAASRLPNGLASYQNQMMKIGQIELIRMMIAEIMPPLGGDDE